MTKRNTTIILAILAVLVVGGIAFKKMSGGGENKEEAPAGFAMPVEAAKAESHTLQMTVQAVGSLVSQEGVVIRPEITGLVKEIMFTEGQQIEKGQPMLRLDDSVFKAQMAQAEAQVALTDRNFNRAQSLLGRGAGTEQARDQANSDQKVAAAALELAKANLEKSMILAPFSGVVGIRKISLGDYVSPGQDLVTLQSLDPMKIDFSVPESALASLGSGLKVNLTVAAYPGEVFAGEVTAIDPLIDPSTRSVAVRALVPNADGRLRPGMFGEVKLVLKEMPDTVFVPSSALWPTGNQLNVFRIVDGTATMVPVTLLQREPTRVAVTGVNAGDQVVTAGQMKLVMGPPGQPVPVMVVDPNAAQAAPATGEKAAEPAKESASEN